MSNTMKRAITVLATMAMAAALCVGLGACSGGSATSEEDQIRTELEKGLSVLKNPTAESLGDLLGSDISELDEIKQYGVDPIEMLQHLFNKFDYSIGDITIDGDTANAQVTMENIDVQTVVTEAISDLENDADFIETATNAYLNGSESDMYKLIFDKVFEAIDASDQTVSSTVDFKLEKTDGQWNFDEDSMADMISSMYGGMDLSL